MSVLVVVKVSGDTDAFQKALADRADEFDFAETFHICSRPSQAKSSC